jgi:hypothetical protein
VAEGGPIDAVARAVVTEIGELGIDGQRRWAKIAQLFESGSQRVTATREKPLVTAAE